MAIRTMESKMITEGVELIDFLTHVGKVKEFLRGATVAPEYKSQWEAAIRKFVDAADSVSFVIRDMEKRNG